MNQREAALVELGVALREGGYHFITTTPATHRRVNARATQRGDILARDLRDVFGWSRPFQPPLLAPRLMSLLESAGALRWEDGLYRSLVRFSSLDALLLVHSAFPTVADDSVFFGPDTYRFCALLKRQVQPTGRVLDLGCGSGAGGLCLSSLARGSAQQLVLSDVNERALSYSRVNSALAGVSPSIVQSDVLAGLTGDFDLIVANPPYMRDAAGRIYRDGGGAYGEGLSLRIVRESLARLAPGGRLVVYTGSAIVAGRDSFRSAVEPVLHARQLRYTYEELDPDVFGEELMQDGYEGVERIAAVALTLTCDSELVGRTHE